MLTELSTHNLIIREIINGVLFPLSTCLTGLITYALYHAMHDHQQRPFLKVPGVTTALAFWGIFTASSIWTGSVYFALRAKAAGGHTERSERLIEIAWLLSGSALAIVILYTIYLFTPPKLGHKVWVGSLIFTAIFLALTRI